MQLIELAEREVHQREQKSVQIISLRLDHADAKNYTLSLSSSRSKFWHCVARYTQNIRNLMLVEAYMWKPACGCQTDDWDGAASQIAIMSKHSTDIRCREQSDQSCNVRD